MKVSPKSLLRIVAVLAVVVACSLSSRTALSDDKQAKKAPSALADQFEALKRLEGTWESEELGTDGKPSQLIFKVTANKTMVMETMFPGSPHEMVNTYHLDGDNLMVTHYCAQGVQPRMKLAADRSDANTLKFDFVDCTNLKAGEGCMGGLEVVIDGDKLIERWSYRNEGKDAGEPTVFEMRRKA